MYFKIYFFENVLYFFSKTLDLVAVSLRYFVPVLEDTCMSNTTGYIYAAINSSEIFVNNS